MDMQKAFEKHIKHDALKKKLPVRLKKRRKAGGTQQRAIFVWFFKISLMQTI